MFNSLLLPIPRLLGFIGLDTSDIVRSASHQGFDQLVSLQIIGSGINEVTRH
jgi:hypothetical protein